MNNNLLVISSFLLCLSCSTSPDFERNNVNDPKSDFFVPDKPQNSPIALSIDDYRNVYVTWNPKELQDGVIISKKYTEYSPYIPIDTLIGIDSLFMDPSKAFTQGTTYQVEFFRMLEDSSFLFSDTPVSASLEFEPFDYIRIYYDNSLEISAGFQDQPRNNSIQYFDGVELQMIRSSDTNSTNWETIGIFDKQAFSDDQLKTDLSYKLFDLRFRVIQFINDSSGTQIPLKTVTNRFRINPIHDVRFTFSDELNGTVNWINTAQYGDGYIIKSNRLDTVYGTPKNSYQLQLTEVPEYPLEVSVKPFINDNFGDFSTSSRSWPLFHRPFLRQLTPIDENSLEISWWVPEDNQAAAFIIRKSLFSESNYLPIDTVSPDQTNYVISNLNTDRQYKFIVHSYASPSSPYYAAAYQNTLVPFQSTPLNVVGQNITYSKNGRYMAKLVPEEFSANYDYILIKDLETNAEYSLEIPREFDDWRSLFRDFSVSEKNNTLIFLWDRDDVDVAWDYISVYDFVEGEYIVENRDTPGNGGYEIELLENDFMVVIKLYNSIQIYDTENNAVIREITPPSLGEWILRSNKNTAIHCSEYGITEYDLTSGDITNQIPEYCTKGQINEASESMTFIGNNTLKHLDLQTFLVSQFVHKPSNTTELTDFWYFKEDDLFIYRPYWSGIYTGLDMVTGTEFSFTIPTYNQDRDGLIQTINRQPDGTYAVISLDGEFTLGFEQSWSLVEKEW